MNNRFLIGFAEGVIVAAAAFALCVNYANAAEFFPTKEAAKAAAHGKHIAWICEGKDRLYYVGRAGEQHCEANRHDRSTVRSVDSEPSRHRRVSDLPAVRPQTIVPTKVKTVSGPVLPVEIPPPAPPVVKPEIKSPVGVARCTGTSTVCDAATEKAVADWVEAHTKQLERMAMLLRTREARR